MPIEDGRRVFRYDASGRLETSSEYEEGWGVDDYFYDAGQDRQEEPTFTWHVTAGELDKWVTAGDERVAWTLPEADEAPDVVQLFCVLRDGRGGTAVWHTSVELD